MSVNYEFFQGKCKWARTHQPDEWGWRITLYPNQESLDKFRALQEKGIKTHLKKDDDGYYFVARRPQSKMMRGMVKHFEAPVVLDKDNKPTGDMIGNGSDVTVKCETYGYKPPTGGTGMAMRLASVRVENLVPYERSDLTSNQDRLVNELPNQPLQTEARF